MKKVLAICLVIVMAVSMSVNAFAAPEGFVSSPSGNPAPTLISFAPSDEDCTARLVITPYGDRHDLSDTLRTMFEKAYNEIVASSDLTELNADLAEVAEGMNIDGADLAVSDLFDIHVTGCDYHDEHVDFDIVLAADVLKNFVGLLHMNKDSVWELVDNAEVVNNGEHLKFSVDSFSPFAIVVNTGDNDVPPTDDSDNPTTGDLNDTQSGGDRAPQTGGSSYARIYLIIMAVAALAAVVIWRKSKRQSV